MSPSSPSKSLSRERFSRLADGYVHSQTHASGDDLSRLLAIANPQPTWRMLDVATGGGHTALAFSPHVASLYATDLSIQMLTAARAHLSSKAISNVDYFAADAEGLAIAPGVFDLVTCRIAAHHFPDPERFALECAQALKPGGLMVVQDQLLPEDTTAATYIDSYERQRDPSHHQAYSASQWRKFYTRAGLMVEHVEELSKPLSFQAWVERQACSPGTVRELETMVRQAPAEVQDWMQPKKFGTPQATSLIHYIIIKGRKP